MTSKEREELISDIRTARAAIDEAHRAVKKLYLRAQLYDAYDTNDGKRFGSFVEGYCAGQDMSRVESDLLLLSSKYAVAEIELRDLIDKKTRR